jgi:cytochrome c peroxidase
MHFTPSRAVLALACCMFSTARGQALPNEPIRPLPESHAGDPTRIALGRQLFFDQRLSNDNKHSCASCHSLAHGGADARPLSAGAGGKFTTFNTPSVYNSAFNFRYAWTGSAGSLGSWLDQHVQAPAVFGSDWAGIAARLDAGGRGAYAENLGPAVARDALLQFVASLATPSRFDRYLRGDAGAISADEKAGYAKFKAYGCAACHQGVNVGGNLYQKLGAMREFPGLAGSGADLGRALVTGRDAERHVFRVPSLRNVALTAPYFHNGSVATLEQAVELMFTYQLGRSAPPQDRELIVRFLRALSGDKLPAADAKQ